MKEMIKDPVLTLQEIIDIAENIEEGNPNLWGEYDRALTDILRLAYEALGQLR